MQARFVGVIIAGVATVAEEGRQDATRAERVGIKEGFGGILPEMERKLRWCDHDICIHDIDTYDQSSPRKNPTFTQNGIFPPLV